MKLLKVAGVAVLSLSLLLGETACSSMTNLGKGAAIGGGGGGALGAGIGALIGGGKGAAIGAGVGAAVGAGAGMLIGKKMDDQQKKLQQELANQAQIDKVTDGNGYQAIRVTFDGGILFGFNSTSLSSSAKTNLAKFATSLKENPNTDVTVLGYTDNVGSLSANQKVATGRADAVRNYLVNCGVAPARVFAQGLPMQDYVASNDTEAGRAQNRRVVVYISANQDMIDAANAGTLK